MHDLTIVASHTVYPVIYSAIVGSLAYGLDGPDSDTDRRGVFQAPTPDFWKLDQPPRHVDGPLPEQFSWELERARTLALAANPTVLECLWSPLVEHVTDAGLALLTLRPAFLSRKAARTYGDYARDQLNKLTSTRAKSGEVRWKQAMHMARLLRAGIHLMRTGEVVADLRPLAALPYVADLIEAKQAGEHRRLPADLVSPARLETDVAALTATLEAARDASRLPASPSAEPALNALLIRTRLSHA